MFFNEATKLTTAKALATRFKLDKDAKSKLREIGEKRAEDMDEAPIAS